MILEIIISIVIGLMLGFNIFLFILLWIFRKELNELVDKKMEDMEKK
jgi:uncharacterized protein YneF (UPF0154 family)